MVPIGGGGLISGVAFAMKQLNPNIKVYGVQAAGAPSMFESIKAHHIETLPKVSTVADGIAVKTPGDLTYEVVNEYVDEIGLVTESEICAAILALIEQHKMVAEGAGAVAVAAAMFNKVPVKGKKTVCLVSGGNIDVTILNRVISRGLEKGGRICMLKIGLSDKPGQMLAVNQVLSDMGANIVNVSHERRAFTEDINACELRVTIETRNHEHLNEIKERLIKAGFSLRE